jgi:hypothetical protein
MVLSLFDDLILAGSKRKSRIILLYLNEVHAFAIVAITGTTKTNVHVTLNRGNLIEGPGHRLILIVIPATGLLGLENGRSHEIVEVSLNALNVNMLTTILKVMESS